MKKQFLLIALAAFVMAACENSPAGGGGGGGGGRSNRDIPSDSSAVPNPDISEADTIITLPGVQTTVTTEGDDIVIRLDMTGIIDPLTGEYLELIGSGVNQNVYVEVDGKKKGIQVTNLSEGSGAIVKADLVFLVDNSGSMDDEADSIANGMDSWSKLLAKSGLDINFGVVGYDGEITGALDLAIADSLSAFLNHPDYSWGTYRTQHFGGPNAQVLYALSPNYYNGGSMDECGMAAFHFANDNFHFRSGANRIYVNFTDEANYYFGIDSFATAWLQTNWQPQLGTIHSVFSDGVDAGNYPENYTSEGYYDAPWLMADYTGGTKLFTDWNFKDVTLQSLPVTGAMQNSYIIRFTNVMEFMDGQPHTVHITIMTTDGSVAGELYFTIVFGGNAA